MNIAVSEAEAPSVWRAGPMTTQAMMNDAVTGTARPSTAIATAANTAVRISTAVGFVTSARAAATSRPARLWPSPVLTMTEVMIPAAAQTDATGRTDRMPMARARYISAP